MVIRPQPLLAVAGATAALSAAAIALGGGSASAATSAVRTGSVSGNWAGYVAQGNNFSSVRGSWVQPSATCSSPGTYSAFWVGLGGDGSQSSALEQTGTQANCTADGSTDYYAWYELVPAAPVKLDLAIKPGDHISATVSVGGSNVTVSLSDQTTGQSTAKTLQMDNPDVSSAEWIAEAPSACDGSGSCQPLPLSDFGTVQFTSATATANGHTGTISDPNWSSQRVALGSSGISDVSYGSDSGASSADPTSLSSDGSSFSVAYQGATGASSGVPSGDGYGNSGYPGDGYGPGGGYGPQGYGGDGYGYSYGDGYGWF